MSTPAVVVEPQLDKAKPQKGSDLSVGRANGVVRIVILVLCIL